MSFYTSTTKTYKHKHEDSYDQLQSTVTPFTMQEPRCNCQRTLDLTLHQKSQKHLTLLCHKAIKPNEEPPPNWRDTTIKAVYKRVGPSSPSYYRPVCSISIMCKVFTQLLFERLQPRLKKVCDQQRATAHTDVNSKQLHVKGEPISHPQNVSCSTHSHGTSRNHHIRKVEQGQPKSQTGLARRRRAGSQMTSFSSSDHSNARRPCLKTTVATTAHGLQEASTKTFISKANMKETTRLQFKGCASTYYHQKGKSKTTITNAIHAEFDHRILLWTTLTSQRQELTSPKEKPLRDSLLLFDATVTPSLLDASSMWTMTEKMQKILQTDSDG